MIRTLQSAAFAAATLAAATLAAAVAVPFAPALAQAPASSAGPGTTAAVAIPEAQMRIAREIVEAAGIARSFDSAFPDFALRIRQNFASSRPELVRDMDDTLVALMPEIRTRRGEMVERAARAVAAPFSEAELREILTFFNSAVGKKYVNSQPQMLQQIFQAMEPWMQQTSEFFLNRFREEMRKKGHTV
jgi:hypothetical protein